jgi:hypothetical protein
VYVASGYRSCPFTIIKQNNNQNTQNTDSISRIQWSCCVCVIMQLIGCMYFCALNLVSSYLRIMMANYKYAEDTSKKEKNSLCRADKKKKTSDDNCTISVLVFHYSVLFFIQSAPIPCRLHNPFKHTLPTVGNLWKCSGKPEWLSLSHTHTHPHTYIHIHTHDLTPWHLGQNGTYSHHVQMI